ncbi:hypothetical protein Trydic_g22394 [Trypoxylus dichotomus]
MKYPALEVESDPLQNSSDKVVAPHSKQQIFMNNLIERLSQIQKHRVPPSKYITEMTCTTSERLEKLKSISRKEKIRIETALNMLRATPDIVVFQNYSIGDTIIVPLNILNTYETSKPVRVILDPSTVFSISCPSGIVNTKVAPGMAYQVDVIFRPHEQKDYRHYLLVVSEGESFFIPLMGLSYRPLLDIPDRIILPATPVKITTERTIIVRNLGEVSATFNICCSPGFLAEPLRGFVDPHDYMQLTIKFNTDIVGDHRGHLVLTHETGETLTVMLEVTSYESNIFLEVNELESLDAYMTLKRKRCVKLYNNSEHTARSAEVDKIENLKYEQTFGQIKEIEARKYADLMHQGIIAGGDTNEVIYDRIYRDELREYRRSETLLYNDLNWRVQPLTGQVWPNNFITFTITFAPTEAKYYKTTMYLEVTGREERLPLKLHGRGEGPQIEINISELNANDIFLCSKHQYEISVRNEGHIPGTIAFVPRPLLFGGIVTCKPKHNYMEPNRYASFVLSFSSNVQGKFVEEIEFVIRESGEIQKFVFKGNIVCPLLNFNVTEVNFGKVTLGYPVSTYINLTNTTQVPIEYVATFPEDGEVPALSCSDYAQQSIKPMIIAPKELSFQPENFTVSPNFTSRGKLTLLPNYQGEYIKRLIIIMWGTPKYSIQLPIIYKCEIPDIVCETQDIFMRGCFVNYVYTRSITIRSRNEHAGYFQFLPYDVEGPTDIMFEPKPAEDFIEGYGAKEVELNIFTNHIGQSILKVYISIFGGSQKVYLCTIRCNGQGPVITVPEVLYFEDIRTLKHVSQFLKIVNDSPVPATVTVAHNKRICCTIDEELLTLNPSESLDLEVKAYVRVPGQFTDKIAFTTEQGESQSCYIKVTAVGSSILCEPEIEPELNLGAILTHQTYTLNVKFTNMSKKYHKLIWTRLKKLKSFRDDPALYEGSIFSLTPNVFDLAPNQSMNCILSGYGYHTGHIEEDFYCHATIEGKRDYAVITTFLVIAEFVRPMLEMSHDHLYFRIDTGVDKTRAFLADTMTVKNISKLAITANLSIEEPFFILNGDEETNSVQRHLENGDVFSFDVKFVPKATKKECVVWNKELVFTYMGHPYKDKIHVKGEENYPNLKIEPMFIDFDYLPNFFTTSVELILKNVSPLPLTFQWEWIKEKIEINKIPALPTQWPVQGSEETASISTISEPTFPPGLDMCTMSSEECEDINYVLHRRIEIDAKPPPTLTSEITEAQPTEHAIISTVERLPEYQDELQLVLYQLVDCYNSSEQSEMEVIRCLPKTVDECKNCCEFFDLIPTYGYLGPYEAQMVSVEFSPYPNTLLKATAYCHPTGGKAEVLNITGGSSTISFSVDSDVIEFGRRLFCEMCERTIIITNTGYASLNIEPFQNDKPENELEGCLPPPNWYSVNLRKISKDYELSVKYFPGVTREFSQKFFLQIGYLPPFSLTIHGYGVLQQIFCALPRPSMDDEIINFLSYKAIASITTSFLRHVKALTQTDTMWKKDINYSIKETLKSEDWVIISFNDEYPTVSDIQMAIERCMVDLYLSSHYQLLYDHTVLRNSTIVSNKLVAAPYLADFQYIIRDTEAFYTATILNYGPDIANLRTVWSRKIALKYGLRAKLANNCLPVGASTELCISFYPLMKSFPTANNLIYETLFILVSHGQKVPIEVKAHVTIPEVTTSEKCIQFSEVNLGCCLRRDITLENTGYVPCNWDAKIEMEGKNMWRSIFHCKTTCGTLAVGEKIILSTYFEPVKDGKFKGWLVINVAQNPNKVSVKLKGIGIKPILKITDHKLYFPSTLPYTENVEIMFSIENVSKCPIEFYFYDFDEEVEKEDLILDVLMEYYKTNRLHIPYRDAGDALPVHLLEFYANLLKSLKNKLNEAHLQSEYGSLSEAESKLLTPRRRSSVGPSNKRSTVLNAALQWDPFAGKTPDEIVILLKEHLREMKQLPSTDFSVNRCDPVSAAIDEALRGSNYTPPDTKIGILLIFHGAPKTEYLRAANIAGCELQLPIVSIDRMLFDALLCPSTLAAIKVRQIIDEAFYSVASETDMQTPSNYDEYDFLQRKIDLLLSGKKKKSLKKTATRESTRSRVKSAASKRSSKQSVNEEKGKKGKQKKEKKDALSVSSGSSRGSTAKAKVDKRPTLIGISEDLLFEIVASQLALYDKGVIIESLNSIIVKKPMMVLNMLLKAIAKESKKISKSSSSKNSKTSKNSRKASSKGGSSKSSKKGDKGKAKKAKAAEKMPSEEQELKKAFTESENLIWEMLHTLEYWDRKQGNLTKPLPVRITSKQSSKKSRSTKSRSSMSSLKSASKYPNTSEKEEGIIKIYSPRELKSASSLGIPCWLIENSLKETDYKYPQRIAAFLQCTKELTQERHSIIHKDTPTLVENTILLSILQKPRKRQEKNISNVFDLIDVDIAVPKEMHKITPLIGSELIPSKGTKRKGNMKKSRNSATSLDRISMISTGTAKAVGSKTFLRSKDGTPELTHKLTPRVVINPKNKYIYKAVFKPKHIGNYTHTFTIELAGWPSKYYIECSGTSELPAFDMDPVVMFEKVVEEKEEGNSIRVAYLLNEKVLDFGMVLLPNMKEYKDKLPMTETKIKLVNKSSQVCETHIFLTEDRISSGVFSLDTTTFSVLPGEYNEITVASCPTVPGTFFGYALVLIKNNPEVQAIQLRCSAVTVNVIYEPKSIEFERSILNALAKKWTKLYNFCPVPIKWRASNIQEVQAHFKISPLSGRIQPGSHQKIDIAFKARITEDVPKKYFKITVLDGNRGDDYTLCSEILGVSAEVIDIQVECPTNINFGELKGRMHHTFDFPILSKIKYNMDFMFTDAPPRNGIKAIRNLFRVNPRHVQLKYGKVSDVSIIFSPKHYIDFANVPIYHCVIADPKTNVMVRNFDVTATATVHCSRFKLCPTTELDFGQQLIGCEKSESIFLENIGKFEFSYVIVSETKMQRAKKKKGKEKKGSKKSNKGSKRTKPKSPTPGSKSSSKNTESTGGKSKKSSKSSKEENKKGKKGKKEKKTPDKKPKAKPTKLNVSCFTLVSSTGTLEPGENTFIHVTAKPTAIGVFEEKILIFISECEPAHRKGIPIVLTSAAIYPKYNFTDFADIFYEQHVLNTISDFNCPEQIDNKQVFVIEENRLYLNKACINYGCESHIKIKSACLVTTTLVAAIDNTTFFSITPTTAVVEPYGYVNFTISFKPTEIKTYQCTLRLQAVNPVSTPDNQFIITITGEGYVPDITIIEPQLDPVDSSYNLVFPPLQIGERAEKVVIFENTCVISCKVIIELWNATGQLLRLSCDESVVESAFDTSLRSTTTVEESNSFIPIKHHMLVKIDPTNTATIRIVFEPKDEVTAIVLLRLYVANNPYEVYNVNINIESYMEDIVISELPPISLQNRGLNVISKYELNFGFCALNCLKHIRFIVTNNSSLFNYRFQFPSFDRLKFSPAVGHLRPKSSKQILVTFVAMSSINLIKQTLQCAICKIEYVFGDLEPLSWDDRQNVVVWKDPSQSSLAEKRSISAPLNARRLQKKSSARLTKRSMEDIPLVRRSSSIIRPGSRKSSSNLSTDTRKSKTDASSLSYKERKLESKPEPPYTTLGDNMKYIELILSVTADYCSYECSVREIKMQDTLMFEKRTATFQINNTSTMPLDLKWFINMDECFPRRINCHNESSNLKGSLKSESERLANIVQPKRLVKSAVQKRVCLIGNEKFLPGNCTPPKISSSATIFSDDGSITNRSRDSWHESDYMPFSIEPSSCVIAPMSTMEFKITFSPIDVFQYLIHLRSNISNLAPNDSGLEVTVQAKSLLPLYHFDILPSDYLSRRQWRCGDPIDENTKVMEFDAVGLNIQHTRKFNIINPTGESFSFRWTPAPRNNNDISLFHCNTPEGSVTKGKMAEAFFTFVPRKHGTFETFYLFIIEKYNIATTFLLTGVARNPCIFFSTSHLVLEGTLANVEVTDTVTLHNKDNVTLNFKFRKGSLFNDDRTRKVMVEPMEGALTSNSSLLITLKFKSSQTGEIDFRLKCDIERMSKPLTLTVKSNIYDVVAQVVYFNDHHKCYLDPKSVNTIELKSLFVHHEDRIKFEISNTGKIGFYYDWQCIDKNYEDYALIQIDPNESYCASLTETINYLIINPLKHLMQKRFKIVLQILYGPKYIIHFVCTTARTNYKFSFLEHDFGKCILQDKKTTYYSTILQFTNLDKQPITLEYDGNHDDGNLTIVFKAKTIHAKKIEKIPIYFHPQELKSYAFILRFFVNSKIDEVIVRGEGTPLVIELVDQEQKFVNLGATLAGKQVTKVVQVINRSNTKIHALFDLYERLPIHHKPKKVLEAEFEKEEIIKQRPIKPKKEKKDKKNKKSGDKKTGSKKESRSSNKSKSSKSKSTDSSKSNKSQKSSKSSKKESKKSKVSISSSTKSNKGKKDKHKATELVEKEQEDPKMTLTRLINGSLEIMPKKFFRILPGDTQSFTITFTPKQKMVSFTKKLFCQVQDHLEPLCLIKGSCVAADYCLDRNKITFGTVAKGGSNISKFLLFNIGDIGGKYKWKFEKTEPSITIEPLEGYISPDMSITFTAKYNPKSTQCNVYATAKCIIEHFKNPLRIQFTGSCINRSAAAGTLKFKCPVRTEATQTVTYQNKMSEQRIIKPKIVGAYFKAQEFVDLQPLSNATCAIYFCPSIMSSSDQPHKATFQLDLPDGHCVIYNLEGVAEAPLPCNKIEKDINCKRQFVQTLEVENWLKTPQQFKVITENTKPNQSQQILYKTTGNSCIDVPGGGTRQYKWGIFVINTGTLNFRVIFKNQATKEYLFYEIQLNVNQGGPLAEINLVSCARSPKIHKLTLENPLKKDVTFAISSNCQRLNYPSSITVTPCSEEVIDITYFPLLPGIIDANLEVTTKELGVFLYHFHLEATNPQPEPPVVFKCPLGSATSKKIPLSSTTRTDFKIKVQNKPIFTVDREYPSSDPNGNDITVTFEPNALGNVQSFLILTSLIGGQYLYPLIGTCTNPTPQGPVKIKFGASTTILFKNPFDHLAEFSLRVEPEVFQVKPTLETIGSKRTLKVVVSILNVKHDIIDHKAIPYTGKLTITYLKDVSPNLRWIYYLESEPRKNLATYT